MKQHWFILAGLAILLTACLKVDEDFHSGAVILNFSVDTLRFDTVFTELGSATRALKVYNTHDQRVQIDRIELTNNSGISFRMNVDGVPAEVVESVEIAPNDSLYIFVEVTVDPDMSVSESPFVGEGLITFHSEGQKQSVLLEAWGQNANYIPNRFGAGGVVRLLCDLGQTVTWDDPKPYVIYGILVIDECTLRLPAGTEIHVHGGLVSSTQGVYNDGSIIVTTRGKIISDGTVDAPVLIQGDRLEEGFQEGAGQWNGIQFATRGNVLNYTTIKNSRFGLLVDSLGTLEANNTQIFNTAGPAIAAYKSQVKLNNCLVYNASAHAIQIINGGNYTFNHCTITSYGVDASALFLSNSVCYRPTPTGCSVIGTNPLNARFKNCIFTGSRPDELILSDISGGEDRSLFDYQFDNCIVKVDRLLNEDNIPNFFDYCNDCIQTKSLDTLFASVQDDDFHLDSLSIAEGTAMPIPEILIDLDDNIRDVTAPDIGCYEYQY